MNYEIIRGIPVNIPQMGQNWTGLGPRKVRYGICVQGLYVNCYR